MNTTKNLHDVSAVLFFILAFAYVAVALTFRNDYMASLMIFLMRLLDIPFALSALLYGGSGLYLQINEGKENSESVWGYVIFAFSLLLFGLVIFINFAFPSQL